MDRLLSSNTPAEVSVGSTGIRLHGGVTHPGGAGTPSFGLYGDAPLDRVRFFGLAVLNRVYNLTWLCPKEGQNLS